ncbi:MAG: tape measure protein [Gammaproteobacteria bacterium]|nr:tape measure protein [Gammaproteobacteria bacterium]
MAAKVGSLKIGIEGDIRGIRKAVNNTNRLLHGLRKDVKSTGGGFKSFRKIAVGSITAIGTAITALAALRGLSSLKDQFIDVNSANERYLATLNTLTGSQSAANQKFKELNQFARETPFQIQGLIEAFIQLKARGVDPTIETMTILGDTVAALGGGKEQINLLAKAFGDVQSKGKIAGQEVIQFANAGINVYGILQEELGLTRDEIQKTGVSASVVIPLLMKNLADRFGGQMVRMRNTWKGVVEEIKSLWREFVTLIGDAGAFESLKDTIKDTRDKFIDFMDSGRAQEWATSISDAISTTIKKFQDFKTAVVESFKFIFGDAEPEGIKKANEALKGSNTIVQTAEGIWTNIKTNIDGTKTAAEGMTGIVKGADGIYRNINKSTEGINKNIEEGKSFIEEHRQGLEALKTAWEIIKTVTGTISTQFSAVFTEGQRLWEIFKDTGVVEVWKDTIGAALDFIRDTIAGAFELITGEELEGEINSIGDAIRQWGEILEPIIKTMGTILSIVGQVAQAFIGVANVIRNKVLGILKKVFAQIKKIAGKAKEVVLNFVGKNSPKKPISQTIKDVKKQLDSLTKESGEYLIQFMGEGSERKPLSEKINDVVKMMSELKTNAGAFALEFADFSDKTLQEQLQLIRKLQTETEYWTWLGRQGSREWGIAAAMGRQLLEQAKQLIDLQAQGVSDGFGGVAEAGAEKEKGSKGSSIRVPDLGRVITSLNQNFNSLSDGMILFGKEVKGFGEAFGRAAKRKQGRENREGSTGGAKTGKPIDRELLEKWYRLFEKTFKEKDSVREFKKSSRPKIQNIINIQSILSEDIAQQIDEKLKQLWNRNRSELKMAMQEG